MSDEKVPPLVSVMGRYKSTPTKPTAGEVRKWAKYLGWEDQLCKEDLETGESVPISDSVIEGWIDEIWPEAQ